MKKLFKSLLVVACVGAIGAGVAAMSACGGGGYTGEAYSLTHKGGYVGYTSITIDKDGNVKKLTLTEVVLPDHFGDTYTKYTYGDVTIELKNEEYLVGTTALKDYLQDEAKCKDFYLAAMGNKITGTKADGKTETVKKTEWSKETNNYWMCDKKEDGSWDNHANPPYSNDAYSQWKWNRDNTVNYVKKNGVVGLLTLVRGTEAAIYPNDEKSTAKMWVDANGVSTGATWSDLGSAPTSGYLSYAQLIVKAFTVAAAKVPAKK